MAYYIPRAHLERMQNMANEGRIIRGNWQKTDEEGRELACLLGSLSPHINSVKDCPAEYMPEWLAHMTPGIDDKVSDDVWEDVIGRYVAVAGRWHVLDDAAWDRIKWTTIDRCLEIAEPHDTNNVGALVRALIARQLAGDSPSNDEWAAARAKAKAVAAKAAEAEPWASVEPWSAVAHAAARWEVVHAVAWATDGAKAAWVWAWDQISDALLTAIETEIEKAT